MYIKKNVLFVKIFLLPLFHHQENVIYVYTNGLVRPRNNDFESASDLNYNCKTCNEQAKFLNEQVFDPDFFYEKVEIVIRYDIKQEVICHCDSPYYCSCYDDPVYDTHEAIFLVPKFIKEEDITKKAKLITIN